MTDPRQVWSSFTHDPRRPENAALRASDQDRDVVHQVLTEAYADGRVDREEFDALSAQVAAARTLGELPAVLEGLIPATSLPAVSPGMTLLSASEIEQRAVEAWREDRRGAFRAFVTVSAIVWAIWYFTSGTDSFPWPAIVSVVAFLNFARVATSEEAIVTENRHRLEKKQRKEIERHRRDEQPPPAAEQP